MSGGSSPGALRNGGSEDFLPWYLRAKTLWPRAANYEAVAVTRAIPALHLAMVLALRVGVVRVREVAVVGILGKTTSLANTPPPLGRWLFFLLWSFHRTQHLNPRKCTNSGSARPLCEATNGTRSCATAAQPLPIAHRPRHMGRAAGLDIYNGTNSITAL